MYCKNCGNEIKKKNKFCNICGSEAPRTEGFVTNSIYWFKKNKSPLIATFVIIVILISIGAISEGDSYNTPNVPTYTEPSTPPQEPTVPLITESQSEMQNKIYSSVVGIKCPIQGSDYVSTGSGSIMTSNGLILTNAHVIPQDKSDNLLTETCLITIPDEKGKVKEIYYGEPIVISTLSGKYDLAFLKINGVYSDDNGVKYGQYPTNFKNPLENVCVNNNVNLGDPVRAFGYPSISGEGYYLTVTDGIVSSIPNDGTIVTSAKIDHGNSGGVAVDKNGCFIGVPSMAQTGEIESLGIIISNEVVVEFINKVDDLLNKQ